ncbi:DUF3775 domain-containing protein [Parvibaculum sp.]|uniref:DUF3775 domain-containing protein n=1 Tax=Parvibaculum sp. TaxID=2024848 RepID=UPI00391D261E
MPTLDSGKVCRIVARARALDTGRPENFPEDRARRELLEIIRTLNEREQVELVALCWVGRRTYAPEEWEEALSEARAAHSERTAEYLVGMPLLADCLEGGLARFGQGCSGFEDGNL